MDAEPKHLFLLNPTAGKHNSTAALVPLIEELCSARGMAHRIEVTTSHGHAEQLAREAAASGGQWRIYACGGDGTLNEVVNGVSGCPNAAVTMIPCGSGNDFIRIFSDPSAFSDLGRLMDPDEAFFDVIQVNDRLSPGVCSVGLDARIGTDVGRFKRLPLVSGSGAYILSILCNVFRGISAHYRIQIDGQTLDDRFTLACVCNGSWYGGGFHPIPQADPADGLLDVLLVKAVKLPQVAAVIGRYKQGRYAELPKLMRYYRCTELSLMADEPVIVNLDGETMIADHIVFRILPGQLRFFYPKGLSWRNE